MKKETFVDLTYIRRPRYPKKLSKKVHLVFNASCDELPFTIFPEMPGYKTLEQMIYLNVNSCKCEVKWKFLNDSFNRCEGIEFDKEFRDKLNSKMTKVNSGFKHYENRLF